MKCINEKCNHYLEGVPLRPHCKLTGFPVEHGCNIINVIIKKEKELVLLNKLANEIQLLQIND